MNKKDWLVQGKNYNLDYELNKEKLCEDEGLLPQTAQEIKKQQKFLKREIAKRTAAIERLEDEEDKTVLTLRYVKGMTWSQIERWFVDRGYTIEQRQLFRIHNRAIKKLKR